MKRTTKVQSTAAQPAPTTHSAKGSRAMKGVAANLAVAAANPAAGPLGGGQAPPPPPPPATGGPPGAPAPVPTAGGQPGAPAPVPATGSQPGAPAPVPTTSGQPGAPSTAPAPAGQPGGTAGSTSTAGTPAPGGGVQLINLPYAVFAQGVAAALDDVADIRAQLPNPARFTGPARAHLAGRLKNGESAVLQEIANIAIMPAYAPFLTSLANLDNGVDPSTFEAPLLKEWLVKADTLQPLAAALTSLAKDLSDTVMQLGSTARPPLLKAYHILKIHARTDPVLQALLKDPLDYYAAIGVAAAKTRAANGKAGGGAVPASPPVTAGTAPAAASGTTPSGK